MEFAEAPVCPSRGPGRPKEFDFRRLCPEIRGRRRGVLFDYVINGLEHELATVENRTVRN
jgi:hypothetical protein